MQLALPRTVWTQRSEGIRALENWLLCWVLLPNLAFWLLSLIGGPPRGFEVLLTGTIGIVLHRAPFPAKMTGFCLALIYSVLSFISSLFNLAILSLIQSLEFLTEMKPSASPEYLLGALALAGTVAIASRQLRKPTTLPPQRLVLAMALTIIAAWADVQMSKADRGTYSRIAEPGAAFSSAARQSGLAGLATGERHVLFVMVEAMGAPTDPAIATKLVDIWAPPEVRARYEVTTGTTPFYGSTTSGEMRELCGRWGDYRELMETKDATCLPALLAAKGYHSQAWHSFSGKMFDRNRWYPNAGFQEMRFGERLVADGADICPGVFPGACDRDVPREIGTTLKQARQPQFLYWLTVNSHLPVLKNKRLQTLDCARFDASLDAAYPMTCRLLQLFDQTGSAMARQITATDFPPTDILIVGDHLPPFFDRYHRTQFEPDHVPWILLRPKNPDRAAGVAASAGPGKVRA
ncbi:sulfatase-like hydrolase/transferase [Sphingosinicella rhizophila]|uniref:Sulfatase-like hydrolase/transferase n=1 Tax=Sphingosinicella rhizophila TaxID=3050082 RepID=A0ABU3Q7S9_9SPHN|nr:sulfatase-like hydrolase/transferase [Sphingosinicella sp. GR2756]MDT9599456.1 sulfatase-like hydrolase/transferase [Sphingosinicella sp. GR2756]